MLQTKSRIADVGALIGELGLDFLKPKLVAAPFTTIQNRALVQDDSQSLKVSLGVERIRFLGLSRMTSERGPSSEPVWAPDSLDSRVRFVGVWIVNATANGTRLTAANNTTDYLEVTFWGTGLNLVNRLGGGGYDIRATVDGGSESANLTASTYSSLLNNREYPTNQILNIASNLSLGLHTVKIRQAAGLSLDVYGIEILNEVSSLQVGAGEHFLSGLKVSFPTAQTLAYNSGFESGVLGSKGGRVLLTLDPQKNLKKYLTPTDATQLNLGSASHSNEEVLRRIFWREFGAKRGDDLSDLTGSGAVTRTFTMNDGTTQALVNANITVQTDTNGVETLAMNNVVGFISIGFVGTGLDLDLWGWTTSNYSDIEVDGVSIGASPSLPSNVSRIEKIVSGLPYGYHVVRLKADAVTNAPGIRNFILYGPKKPSVPSDEVVLADYNIVANFVANSTAGMDRISTGVIRKLVSREVSYVGAGWNAPLDLTSLTGFRFQSGATPGEYVEYVFFGTGFDFRFNGVNTNNSENVTVSVDGSTNLSGFTTSVYGAGVSFTAATGLLDMGTTAGSTNGLVVSGLSLDFHKVRLTNNSATRFLRVDSFDVITPIHINNIGVGSLALNSKRKDRPSTLSQEETDLSKAKALLVYDTSAELVRRSYNVAMVRKIGTGVIQIYFKKPFKDNHYVVVTQSAAGESRADGPGVNRYPSSCRVVSANSAGTSTDATLNIAIFGELEDDEWEA